MNKSRLSNIPLIETNKSVLTADDSSFFFSSTFTAAGAAAAPVEAAGAPPPPPINRRQTLNKQYFKNAKIPEPGAGVIRSKLEIWPIREAKMEVQ